MTKKKPSINWSAFKGLKTLKEQRDFLTKLIDEGRLSEDEKGNCLILSTKRSHSGIVFNPTDFGDVKYYPVSVRDAWDYVAFLQNPDLIAGRFKPF